MFLLLFSKAYLIETIYTEYTLADHACSLEIWGMQLFLMLTDGYSPLFVYTVSVIDILASFIWQGFSNILFGFPEMYH